MFARPIEKFPCCGSSASSHPSRCWFIIAVAIVKCSAGAPSSLNGFGFSFDSPNSADERADQQCDDAEMRDEEGKMMFAPRPARQRGTGKVRPEQDQPDVEPRRSINVSARNFCVET